MYIGYVLPDGKKHITLTFNGHEETKQEYKGAVSALADAALRWMRPPITAMMSGDMEQFGPKNDMWVTLVDSPQLHEFRHLLGDRLFGIGVPYATEFAYRPHIFMTKWKKPKQGLTGELLIDTLSVMSNEFGRTDIRV